MNDDEVGRFLRDEVPAPGPGYWDAIDERLAAVGSDTAGAATDADVDSVPQGGADGSIDPDVDESSETTDMGAEVIRLTDMTTRSANRFRSAPVLVGAAAALIVLLGLGVALTRGDDAQEVATDDGNPDTETTELDADPSSDPETDPAAADESDAAGGSGPDGSDPDGTEAGPGDPDAIRYCYAGGELANGVVSYVDLSAPIETGPTVRIASRAVFGDETFYEVIDGVVSPDGAVTGQFTDLGSGARFEAMFVFVSEDGLSLADDVFVEPVDCGDVADDVADIETTVNSVDLDEIAIPQPQTNPEIDFLPGEYPRLWSIIERAQVYQSPGTEQPGGELFVGQIRAGTGRLAQADGQVWIELAAGQETPKLWARESDLAEHFVPAFAEGIEFLEDDEEPRIWSIASDDTVFGLSQPGLDDEVVATFEPGEQLLAGTALRASADGQLWIQLEARPVLPGADSERSWVPRDALEQSIPELRCYASPDWESEVLVTVWDADADGFTGTLILRTSDAVTAEFFAANGVLNIAQGSSFTVNVQEFGSPEIVTEEWRGVRDGFSLGTRALPSTVPCTFVIDSVIELAGYDGSPTPPRPEPAG